MIIVCKLLMTTWNNHWGGNSGESFYVVFLTQRPPGVSCRFPSHVEELSHHSDLSDLHQIWQLSCPVCRNLRMQGPPR